MLLLEPLGDGEWEGLARPTRRLRAGRRYGPVELLEHLGGGRWRLRLSGPPAGQIPLPPYISEPLADPERYQTVYAAVEGSAAAPTAGLHLSEELVALLDPVRVTLHAGLDTFRPLQEERLDDHLIHGERYRVRRRHGSGSPTRPASRRWARPQCACSRRSPTADHCSGRTELFVTPGFEFRRVDCLLTNFHFPRSTLLALVMAFAGVEETRRLYATAIAERYRFFSFGDAMLIL